MANEKRLIDANAFKVFLEEIRQEYLEEDTFSSDFAACVIETVEDEYLSLAPTVDAYTAHEVAEIIADLFGDTCACNFNGIDEWLPEKCELLDACPDTVGVACWEQYLKYRSAKMDGDGNA